jgi:signal transduction histidine kinase
MGSWPLRKKLFITVGGGAAALALVMSLLVDLTVVEQVFKYEDQGLEQTRNAFDALMAYRRAQLLERCRLISELPHFKAAASVYDPSLSPGEQVEALSTVSDMAHRILSQTDVDLLTLTGNDGIPFMSAGPAVEKGVNDLSPLRQIAQRAVSQMNGDGFLVLGSGLVYVTAVRVEVGGLNLGTLCLGKSFDSQAAGSLESMTGSAVAIVGNRGVLAQSAGVPYEAASRLGSIWQELRAQPESAENRPPITIDGDRYRTLWLPLEGADLLPIGALVVLRSEDQALSFLSNVRQGLLGIALAAIVVAIFFSYLFARQITNPVLRLVAFTKRVGRGEMLARVHIGTRDELAALGDAFNEMVRRLSESRDHLETSNRVLEERQGELEEANEDLRRSKEEAESISRSLQEAHAQLIQAGKMAAFGELGAGLAHELKQPLSSIRGFAQLMERKLGTDHPDTKRHLTMIIQSVDHMTKIVQGLKDFARPSDFQFEEVDVAEVMERTCLLLGSHLRSAGITVESDLDRSVPRVRGDANQLQQVFTNLLANARDAMEEEGGAVTIRSRSLGEGSYVMISVRDEGPGIPAEVLPKVFKTFFTTKPEGKGTGLGLSISQGIVKDHGGRMDVQSAPGEGTTFRIFLPTRDAKRCWETIDCVQDCRPEIAGKEECQIYLEGRGHRCWESLRELARDNPRVTQPDCEQCPVYMEKTAFISSPPPEDTRRAA